MARVPNSVRKWFLKIPESGGNGVTVYAEICESSGEKIVELVGTQIDTGFSDAKIKWSGQESK